MDVFFSEGGKRTFLTGVDSRVKLVSAAALLTMVLTCRGFLFPLLLVLLCLTLAAATGVNFKRFLLRLSEPLLIVGVLIVIKLLFSGKEVIGTAHLFGITLSAHKDGLIEGLLVGSRIISGVSIIGVLVASTPFTEFLGSLAWFRIPKGLIEISIFAYRYIFLLIDDAMVIYNAQKNRLGYSSIRRSFSSIGVLAGSLTLKAFDNSQHAATAMVQRGYDGSVPMAAGKPVRKSHLALSALFLLFMVIVWKI
jgi:cobalt/nickel transport system permease protein